MFIFKPELLCLKLRILQLKIIVTDSKNHSILKRLKLKQAKYLPEHIYRTAFQLQLLCRQKPSKIYLLCCCACFLLLFQTLAFQSILACVLGLVLAFVVIFLGTQNIITGLVATFLLACVTVCVVAIMPLAGWTFGVSD